MASRTPISVTSAKEPAAASRTRTCVTTAKETAAGSPTRTCAMAARARAAASRTRISDTCAKERAAASRTRTCVHFCEGTCSGIADSTLSYRLQRQSAVSTLWRASHRSIDPDTRWGAAAGVFNRPRGVGGTKPISAKTAEPDHESLLMLYSAGDGNGLQAGHTTEQHLERLGDRHRGSSLRLQRRSRHPAAPPHMLAPCALSFRSSFSLSSSRAVERRSCAAARRRRRLHAELVHRARHRLSPWAGGPGAAVCREGTTRDEARLSTEPERCGARGDVRRTRRVPPRSPAACAARTEPTFGGMLCERCADGLHDDGAGGCTDDPCVPARAPASGRCDPGTATASARRACTRGRRLRPRI